ncbi:MAG: subclass B1 metallo-beta-lactamase [Gammaproteobacteria bacterium]
MRIAPILLLLCLVLPFAVTGAESLQLAEDLKVSQLDAHTWLHVSGLARQNSSAAPANGLILEQGNILVIIDTPWTLAQTAALLDWATAKFEKPVAYVIATHGHRDQVGGAAVLANRNIPIFMHATALDFADAPVLSKDLVRELNLRAGGNFVLNNLEIFFPGHGHAPGNLVIYLPATKTLFGGCLVKAAAASSLGNVQEASIAGWQYAINAMLKNYPKAITVVPGHGEPGDYSLLAHTLELLRAREPEQP